MKIYLIGSLRNPEIPRVGDQLRRAGFDVFDDWFAGGPIADDSWQEYEKGRGRDYRTALYGPAARNIFQFDHSNLVKSDAAVLVLPAGKSGHLELGFMVGLGKRGYVLFPEEPERWDVMYQFADDVFFSTDTLIRDLSHWLSSSESSSSSSSQEQ